MGRTNPLALRLRTTLNWPSSVRHPLLASYISHIFQTSLASTPAIRASTSGIWVNITILSPQNQQQPPHPLLTSPPAALDLRNSNPLAALGKIDRRVTKASRQHVYFRDVFRNKAKNPVQALGGSEDPLRALAVYRDTPVHVKVNVITNPLLNAQVCAAFIARELNRNKTMPRIYKGLLGKM
ncbi:uncharacterized protein EV422DRAFT_576470 [Fimicolochytrium jonesii]|uniref:uncharacterized protein n=1 Tax=Fimicolochytrium jonesii TaxID=1396493 RepID=UPI0022FEB37C|nr:uncharacterized protein EV422DRAFT_576470 [Fimicolochytrium jonesii]KAI8823969.1 hypothetical protein EV422DRAFT_576470 [Fimicolochytrium jonesii]